MNNIYYYITARVNYTEWISGVDIKSESILISNKLIKCISECKLFDIKVDINSVYQPSINIACCNGVSDSSTLEIFNERTKINAAMHLYTELMYRVDISS